MKRSERVTVPGSDEQPLWLESMVSRKRPLAAYAVSVAIHSFVFLLPVIALLLNRVPPPRPPEPPEPPHTARKHEPVRVFIVHTTIVKWVEKPKLTLKTKVPAREMRGAVALRFALDKDQQIPTVMNHNGGLLAFCDGDQIIQFAAQGPQWAPATEGVGRLRRSYFSLEIDQPSGRYQFIERVRQQHRHETDLFQAWILFEPEVGAELSEMVRNAAADPAIGCEPLDNIFGLIGYGPAGDFIVEHVECRRPQ
jgi:hypothetical protein